MPIKHSLLALLADGPRPASQLQQQFSERTQDVWPLNIGQVTQTLARLERDGLVEVAGTITGANNRPADTYRLTDDGQELLDAWWHSPVHRPATERDELVIKVSLAAQNRAIDLIGLLDRQRRATLTRLRELNRASRTLDHTRTAERLQVERRIFDLESELRWPSPTPPRRPDMSPTTPAPLELQNVTCVFGDGPRRVVALEDVSLVLEPGELVAVMGPSGSGKSTLLNVAGLLHPPTSGRVLVDGVDAADLSPARAAQLRPPSPSGRTSPCPSSSTAAPPPTAGRPPGSPCRRSASPGWPTASPRRSRAGRPSAPPSPGR